MTACCICRFRGALKKNRRRTGAFTHQALVLIPPVTEKRIASSKARWILHREGGCVRQSMSPGGKRKEIFGQILQYQCRQEFGQQETARQGGIFRRQMSQLQKTLHAFEGQFDLPAESIQLQAL